PFFLFRRSCSSLRSDTRGGPPPPDPPNPVVAPSAPPLSFPAQLFLAALGHSGGSAPRGPPEPRGGAFGAPSFCSGEAVPRCARASPVTTALASLGRRQASALPSRPFLYRRSCSSLRSDTRGLRPREPPEPRGGAFGAPSFCSGEA